MDCTFRNLTARDVTSEVIFPLPPIPVADLMNSMWNLPEDADRENLMYFKALAVVQPEVWWDQPPAAQYDAPGKDVTALLQQYGLPLTLGEKAQEAVSALAPAPRDALLAAGAIGDYDDTAAFDLYPAWSVVLRYHWTPNLPGRRGGKGSSRL